MSRWQLCRKTNPAYKPQIHRFIITPEGGADHSEQCMWYRACFMRFLQSSGMLCAACCMSCAACRTSCAAQPAPCASSRGRAASVSGTASASFPAAAHKMRQPPPTAANKVAIGIRLTCSRHILRSVAGLMPSSRADCFKGLLMYLPTQSTV
jgi:hypothetical protein